jgi:hypothetical protein
VDRVVKEGGFGQAVTLVYAGFAALWRHQRRKFFSLQVFVDEVRRRPLNIRPVRHRRLLLREQPIFAVLTLRERMMMDREQEEQVNLAAEKFAEAIRESYQALADRSVSAQELNAQLTQDFFNGVINNLRSQAGSNQALAENLIEQQHKQQEASQALTQETLKAYMDVLNSMFSFAQGSTQAAQGDHESRRPRDFEGRFVRGEEEWHESEHPRDTGGGSPDNGVLLQPQRDLSSSAQKQEDG